MDDSRDLGIVIQVPPPEGMVQLNSDIANKAKTGEKPWKQKHRHCIKAGGRAKSYLNRNARSFCTPR